MKVGFDFHNVIDAYPLIFGQLAWNHLDCGDEVHVISAIGPKRKGTIKGEVTKLGILHTDVHEVVFKQSRQSPALKTAKALELGLIIFYDDRADVCSAMNAAGILCFQVPRPGSKSDIAADFK